MRTSAAPCQGQSQGHAQVVVIILALGRGADVGGEAALFGKLGLDGLGRESALAVVIQPEDNVVDVRVFVQVVCERQGEDLVPGFIHASQRYKVIPPPVVTDMQL